MGTLHVCFADLPKYSAALSANKNADIIISSNVAASAAANAENDDAITTQSRHHLSVSPSSSSVSPTPRYERNMGFFRQLSRRFGLRSNDDLVYNAEDDSTDSCSSTTGTMPPMQSSSATSMSSTTSRRSANNGDTLKDVVHHGSSLDHLSCASSETSSTIDIEDQQQQQQQQRQGMNSKQSIASKERKSSARSSFSRLHRRSASSLRRAFESFSLSSRSLSCSGTTLPPQQRDGSNGSTPIKSALKSSSNIELNKKSTITTASSVSHSTTTLSTSSSSKSASKSKSKPPPQRILRQPVSYTYLKGISGLPTQRVPRSAVCCQHARR